MRNLLVAVVVLGVGGFFGAKFYVQHKTAQDLDAVLAQARPFVDIEYEQVVATHARRTARRGRDRSHAAVRRCRYVESVGLQTPGFLFLLGFDQRELELPERLGVALTGIRVNADADFMRELDELQRCRPPLRADAGRSVRDLVRVHAGGC